MSRAIMICAVATVLALSFSACSAQDPKVAAQKLYDQLDQSAANHDLNQTLDFYDPTCVVIDERGNREAFAELRKALEQWLPRARNISQSTKVQDVKLEADRMVVHAEGEMHYELNAQRLGWVPQIVKVSGEDTWERKDGQWKLVLSKTLRAETGIDPQWMASQQKTIQNLVDTCEWNGVACNANCRVWGGAGPPPDPHRCIEYCERRKQLCLATLCETDLRLSYPSARSVCGG